MKLVHIPVLVLLALFAGSACSSGNSSKISKGDAASLNQANTNMVTLNTQMAAKLQKCSNAGKTIACRKLLASYMDQMLSAADTYDQIGDKASGDCGGPIHVMARDIRKLANAVKRGSSEKITQQFIDDEDAMFSACKLKEL